jgi:hypothetical protein
VNILHDMLYYAGLFIYTDMVNYWDMCALGLCMLLHRFGFIKMELVRIFWLKTNTDEEETV